MKMTMMIMLNHCHGLTTTTTTTMLFFTSGRNQLYSVLRAPPHGPDVRRSRRTGPVVTAASAPTIVIVAVKVDKNAAVQHVGHCGHAHGRGGVCRRPVHSLQLHSHLPGSE